MPNVNIQHVNVLKRQCELAAARELATFCVAFGVSSCSVASVELFW